MWTPTPSNISYLKQTHLRMGVAKFLEYPVDMTKLNTHFPKWSHIDFPHIITSGYSSLRPCSAALRLYLDFQVEKVDAKGKGIRNKKMSRLGKWKGWTKIDTSTLRFQWKLDISPERYITKSKTGFLFYHFCHPTLQLLPKITTFLQSDMFFP